MKRGVKAAFSMMLLLGSVSAMAGSKLTAEECNDYPFKPVVGRGSRVNEPFVDRDGLGETPGRLSEVLTNPI